MTDRALFLTPIYEPYVGGAAVHFKQLSRGLLESGAISSYVIISAYSPIAPIYETTDDGTIVRILFSPNTINREWSTTKVILNYLLVALLTLLFLSRVSVVHTHTRSYFTVGARLAKLARKHVIIDGRDLGAPSFAARGDVFVCASKNIEREARERAEQVVYIPVGIDPEALMVDPGTTETPTDPYVLFVGDVTRRKGVPELLQAHDSSDRNLQLLLIGEQVTDDIQIGEFSDVSYLGPCAHEEVLCYIRNAELVVLPSKEEGLPRVVLESVFHDTPVLCPPVVPECRQFLEEMTLSSVDSAEIRERMNDVLDRGLEPDKFPIKDHYLSNVIRQYVSVYKSLAQTSDGSMESTPGH